MGEVDLCEQMEKTYEVDRFKFRFCLRVFSDLLDITIVNSKFLLQY